MAAASASCAAAAAATPRPVAIAVDKPKPPKPNAADVSSRSLMVRHLERCRCIGIEESQTISGVRFIKTTHIDVTDGVAPWANLNKEAMHMIAGAKPLSIQYVCESTNSRVDVTTLGKGYEKVKLPWEQPVKKIIVEWVV